MIVATNGVSASSFDGIPPHDDVPTYKFNVASKRRPRPPSPRPNRPISPRIKASPPPPIST
ncbi:hypothetical protein DITRI_Ditri06bG0144200 [Diplodiscus trichospermus]